MADAHAMRSWIMDIQRFHVAGSRMNMLLGTRSWVTGWNLMTQRLTRLKSEAAAEQQLLVPDDTSSAAAEKIQQAHYYVVQPS